MNDRFQQLEYAMNGRMKTADLAAEDDTPARCPDRIARVG
jgi:hypothetical protein